MTSADASLAFPSLVAADSSKGVAHGAGAWFMRPYVATSTIVVMVVFFLLIPVAYGSFVGLEHALFRFGSHVTTMAVVLIMLLAIVAAAFAIRPMSVKSEIGVIVTLTAMSLLLKCVHLFLFESAIFSDFKSMWEFAVSFANGEVYSATTITSERALASLVPLTVVFGTSVAVFKVFNLLAFIANALILYAMVRKAFGVHAALLGYVLACISPEPLLAMAVPTHEVSGALYGTIGIGLFWLLARAVWSRSNGFVYRGLISVALGLALFLVDVQRNLSGALYFAAILVSLAFVFAHLSAVFLRHTQLRLRPILYSLVFCVIVPGVVLSGSWATLYASGLSIYRGIERDTLFYKFLFYDAHAYSASTNWTAFGDRHLMALESVYPDERDRYEVIRDMSFDVATADVTQNTDQRIASYLIKSKWLFNFGNHSFYGIANEKQRFFTYQGAIDYVTQILRINIIYLHVVFLFISVGLIARFALKPTRLMHLYPLLALAVYSGGMIFLGETRTSYAYLIALVLGFYIGPAIQGYGRLMHLAGTFFRSPRSVWTNSTVPQAATYLLPVAGLVLVFTTVYVTAAIAYGVRDSRYVLTPAWSERSAEGAWQAAPKGFLGTFGSPVFDNERGPSRTDVTFRVELPDLQSGHYRTGFFVRMGSAFRGVVPTECCVVLETAIGERVLDTRSLDGSKYVEYVEVGPFEPNGGAIEIAFKATEAMRAALAGETKTLITVELEYLRVWSAEARSAAAECDVVPCGRRPAPLGLSRDTRG
jgi:hypothetical protein